MNRPTYIRLSGYYWLYFAGLGVWIPYWPLFLKHLGQSAEAIGILTATAMGLRVFGTPAWGALADRGRRNPVIVGTSLATVLAFSLFFWAEGQGFLFLLVATLLYSIVHAGPLALVEATTMELVTRLKGDYGRIRLWGSVGFIVLAIGAGPVVDLYGISTVTWMMVLLLLGCAWITLGIPEGEGRPASGADRNPLTLLKQKRARWFFLATLLMQFSHAGYYGFMSIHLENHGYSKTVIGLLWALGVLAEVGVMHWSRWLLARFGVSTLLTGSLVVAALRWGIYAVTLWWPLLLFGQTLHAITFGAYHVAGVKRAHELATPETRATYQAWYSSLSFGVGGGLGLMASGFIFHYWGAEALFGVMAVSALIGVWVAMVSARLMEHE